MLLKPFLKFILLVASAVLLSITTVIFGALPMRALRKLYGRFAFWTVFTVTGILIAVFASASYGLLILSLAVAVGVYSEIEVHGGSVFTSSFVAILAAIGMTVLGVGAWVQRTKIAVIDVIREQLNPLVDKLATMNASSSVSVDSVIQLLPSGMVIGLMSALAISLIGERRLLGWLGSPVTPAKSPLSFRLSSFRAPDAFIWIAIVAILGAYFRHGNAWIEGISLNVLNVLVVVFFFQGLAVIAHAFRAYRVSPFWQGLWYIVLVLQLFLLVSFIGFADFWIEFRERFSKKTAQTNKGI